MKDILLAFATYNREADKRLVSILSGLDEALLREDQGSYYKSILGTLVHVAAGELSWLRRFAGFFSYRCLAASPLLALEPEQAKARLESGPSALFALLGEIDALLVAFAEELREEDLAVRVKYRNMKGEELERAYWNLVFHILNHGTHHRGEISALLDRKGVANDFSGFNLYTS